MTLDQLARHRIATVTGFAQGSGELEARLREVGFAESDEVELLHRGPLGARPLCYRLNRTMVALRLDEASVITIAPKA